MNYAILENGVVTNVISLNPSNASEFPAAVPLNDYPVTMGDTYLNGVFFRDGTILPAVNEESLTLEECLQMLADLGVDVSG